MNTLKPENELERLTALREYRVLDTLAEKAYDDIARLAAHLCHVPISMVSLVDEQRQWFKARVGISARETPRKVAFCSHAILRSRPMIVRDARRDHWFARNELVAAAPHIRFYAGFPLINPEGFALGTLCAIDRKPHNLSAEQVRSMQALSRQVMALLELRRVSVHLAEALKHVKTLHGLLPICVWCKRIRDDQGYWNQVENYISAHSEADFTHGICPRCLDTERRKQAPGKNRAASSPQT